MSLLLTSATLSTLLLGFALFVFAPCVGMCIYAHRAASASYQESYPHNHRVQEKMPLWLLSESLPRLHEKLRLDPSEDAPLIATIARFYRWQRIVQMLIPVGVLLLVARLAVG